MTRDEAIDLTALIVGIFPEKQQPADPEAFTRALVMTLEEHPLEAGKAAFDAVRRNSRWLPTVAEVHEACCAWKVKRIMAEREAEKKRLDATQQAGRSLPKPNPHRAAQLRALTGQIGRK